MQEIKEYYSVIEVKKPVFGKRLFDTAKEAQDESDKLAKIDIDTKIVKESFFS